MYVVIRQYEGAPALVDAMTSRADEVRELIQGVNGFVAYYAARDGDAVTTISVCDDRAGADETTRRAAEWVRENLGGLSPSPPRVSGGEVYVSF